MTNFSEVKADIFETIKEGREVTIENEKTYSHFYEEEDKIVSCNKLGEKEKIYQSIQELFDDIGINCDNFKDYTIEMY